MMNKELFEEFIQFCNSQPRDEIINHWCWEECALGKFAKHKQKDLDIKSMYDFSLEVLGDSYLRDYIDDIRCPLETYGEFTDYLNFYRRFL